MIKSYFYINKPAFFKFLFLGLLTCIIFYLTADVLHCDDGLIPVNDSYYYDGLIPVNESHVTTAYNTSCWENNYHNRTEQIAYPIFRDGQPIYQAYNEGIQATSQGYRYEVGGGSGVININATNYSMSGRPVPLEYIGEDIQGNPLYSYTYPTSTSSTQLGEIHPVANEVINNKYYKVDWPQRKVHFEEATLYQKLANKAKSTVLKRLVKYNEPTSQRRERRDARDRAMWEEKWARRANEAHRDYEKRKAVYESQRQRESYRKVNRFD